MSWYMIVQPLQCWGDQACTLKYIVYGTGNEVPSQLFDLTNDPDEMTNLIGNTDFQTAIQTLDGNLRSVVDYPRVSRNVAQYNKDSFVKWVQRTPHWNKSIKAPDLRWTESWDNDVVGDEDRAMAALHKWMDAPVEVVGCRNTTVWPSL